MKLNTIVISAFNRPKSLSRLLGSLKNVLFENERINLIISIDKSDCEEVYRIAKEFDWLFGQKEIIKRTSNLGLRKHVMECASLTKECESIILLEDDLYVSPFLFQYAKSVFHYYVSEPHVSGISLFSHNFNECVRFPFFPIEDGSDIFFLQIASSWGQILWDEQWSEFLSWYTRNPKIDQMKGIPGKIKNWPDSSWKKYYIAFLIQTGKYFAYPRISLSTNFSDKGGQHIKQQNAISQVPLLSGPKEWKYIPFNQSMVKYDAFCELNPYCMKNLNNQLAEYSFEVDLYGDKNLNDMKAPFIITSKKAKIRNISYGLSFKNIDSNILLNNPGKFFCLSPKSSVIDSSIEEVIRKVEFFNFYYRETSFGMYILLMIKKLFNKLQ